MEKYNFQVNLGGMIDILSNHLYSEQRVFIRELLQNASDAIVARKNLNENDEKEKIHVELWEGIENTPPTLSFEDNGIGLNEEEVHQFLSSIGASSKKNDLAESRDDFIGQFGIGLLSCFMVTDEITMITQSAKGGDAIEWHGYIDGSYTINKIKTRAKAGTSVYLIANKQSEYLFKAKEIKSNLRYYGDILPVSITLTSNNSEAKIVNKGSSPWLRKFSSEEEKSIELLRFGRHFFNLPKIQHFIPLKTKDGKTNGVAYLVPYQLAGSAKTGHTVYLKNMLITKESYEILPEWAVFVKSVVNTSVLRPTASRESFYKDETLSETRKELGQIIISHLINLDREKPEELKAILNIHQYSMMALALEYDDFFEVIVHHFRFHSSEGELSIIELQELSNYLNITTNYKEYEKLLSLAKAQNIPLINGGILHYSELFDKIAYHFPSIKLRTVNSDYFANFFSDLSLVEHEQVFDFENYTLEILKEFKTKVLIRKFLPANIPTVFLANDKAIFMREAEKVKQQADTVWQMAINNLMENTESDSYGTLCFNYNNTLIQEVLKIKNAELQKLYIRILYVQSLQASSISLQKKETAILNTSLIDLIKFINE